MFREFDRIKINPQSNVLDLYNLKDMGIKVENSSIQELKNNKEEYKDFYVKLLPSEFKKKENYAFVGVTDGFNNISVFVPKEFLSRYVDDLKTVGTPLLCHLHGKGEKYSLVSLINLQNIDKYKHEYWWYTGQATDKLQQLRSANPTVDCCIASNISYFVSKNGNPCVRYDAVIDEKNVLEGRINVNPPLMVEGSFVFFSLGSNSVFLDIIQVA